MAVDGWRDGRLLKPWQNTMILMAQGLEHRKTRVLEGSRMVVDGWRHGRLLKTWENTMILMAERLEHRKTRVLEGSRMAVGGAGAAPCGALVKQRFGRQK